MDADLHTPELSVVTLADLDARVVVRYDAGTVTVQQPLRHGGTVTRPLADYDRHDGDLRDWIAALTLRDRAPRFDFSAGCPRNRAASRREGAILSQVFVFTD